jgi:hypothetical protein
MLRFILFAGFFIWIGMLVAKHSKASWIDKATGTKEDPKE